MAAVPNDWHDHLVIGAVVRENCLETTCQVKELLVCRDFRLKNLRFDSLDTLMALAKVVKP